MSIPIASLVSNSPLLREGALVPPLQGHRPSMGRAQRGDHGGVPEAREDPDLPLVVTPDGQGLQDSTPILDRFEASTRRRACIRRIRSRPSPRS